MFSIAIDFVGAFEKDGNMRITVTKTGTKEAAVTVDEPLGDVADGASKVVTVPIAGLEADGTYTLDVAILSANEKYLDSSEITVKTTQQLGYITLDKPIYKPGQTVKARAFAVSAGLHAVRTEVQVEATDPAGNKIKRWTLQAEKGFVSFEMYAPFERERERESAFARTSALIKVAVWQGNPESDTGGGAANPAANYFNYSSAQPPIPSLSLTLSLLDSYLFFFFLFSKNGEGYKDWD